MSLVDLILNLVALLLWLSWRGAEITPRPVAGASLAGTLRPAGPAKGRWPYLAWLVLLLTARSVFYWQIGPPVDWVPRLPVGPTTLPFSSHYPERIFLFSLLSFGATLGVFYLWLLLLSWVTAGAAEADTGRRLIRAQLGIIDRWPNWVKPLVPLVVAGAAWWALHPLLQRLGLTPAPSSAWRLVGQSAVVGLAVYLTLKFLLLALFVLHLVNSYVYLGEFSFWRFVNIVTRELMRPLQWLPLRAGKLDFRPVAAIILVFLAAEYSQRELTRLYEKLL